MSVISKQTIEDILLDAIVQTNDAFGVFDAEDKVVFFNYPFCELFAQTEQAILSQSFEQLIRSCFERKAGVNVETDDIEAWLTMANLKRRSAPYRSFEVDTCDGRWLRLTEMIVGDYIVTYGTDVTASKELELELVETKNKLQQLAATDYLTGIYNRRQFNKMAVQELLRCERKKLHATLMLLDIDHFKHINDTYGHACGDAILVGFTDRIRGELRSYDIFARIGGEEFAVLLPEVCNEKANMIAERYLKKIAEVPFYYNGEYITVTTSIGLSESYPNVKTLDYALQSADKFLYQAKQQGRNRSEGPI